MAKEHELQRNNRVEDLENPGKLGKISRIYMTHNGWGEERITVRWDNGEREDDLTADLLRKIE